MLSVAGLGAPGNHPVLRIGVSDAPGDGDEPALEVQDVFTFTLSELRGLSRSTLPDAFGPTVSEPSQ